MQITDYTSYEEVRAALGVTDEDLEDDQLVLQMYADVLQIELEDVHVNLIGTYNDAVATATPTVDQQRFMQAAHLFATYAVARHLAATLPLFSPEQVTDGKAMTRRAQSDGPYQKAIEAVGREYARFRVRLSQMFAVLSSSSTGSSLVAKSYFSTVTPSSDPVTGA